MMKSTAKCPQYAVIAAATDGNEMAIHKVLNHYDAYISKASLRPLFDEYGNIYLAVDMELKGRIRTALMKMIMKFEMEIV
ncbi:MAG: helix-turn-helix domain-containing protein [Dorea sp.]|nr:helix-turn-helix domain-containing protein [Dorea sp.]